MVLYLLIPIIPATILFLVFPKSTASGEGTISKLKYKVGGAFAGYVIVLLIFNETFSFAKEMITKQQIIDEKRS